MSRSRKEKAFDIRVKATTIARNRPHPKHLSNGDEEKYSGTKEKYLASFT